MLDLKSFFRQAGKGKAVIALLLCIFITAGGIEVVPAKAAPDAPEGYKTVAETARLILSFNEWDHSVIIEDRGTGYQWNSIVGEGGIPAENLNAQWKSNLKSLFNITYTNLKTGDGTLVTASSDFLKPKISSGAKDGGIVLTYDFPGIQVSLSLEFAVEADTLTVRIPADSIRESGDIGIVSIELLPFLGAAGDDKDGYLFYPDGSGAIMKYRDPAHYGQKKQTWSIYGSDIADYMAEVMGDSATSGNGSAALPVFGINHGENGILAVIAEGEYDTVINLTPSGNVVDLNRISPEFIYRRFFIDPRTRKKVVKKYDKELSGNDHAVKYILLSGKDAGYSGMANAYRDYLLEKGILEKKIKDGDPIPLGLDLFMGISEKTLIFDRFLPMTRFKDAKAIFRKFREKGVEHIQSNLLGWTKKGMYTEPSYFPTNRRLGGNAGLKDLAEYASENSIDLFLYTDFQNANAKYGNFSKRNDVVYQSNGLVITGQNNQWFLFNPMAALRFFTDHFLKKAKECGNVGVNFSYFGDFIYYDYNQKNPSTKKQTADTWNRIMGESSEELGKTSVVTGNLYSLKYADKIDSVPSEDNGLFITSEAVPFYQMVVHGILPYTTPMMEAGNLTADIKEQKLKWIEYGYMPYFQLTYESPERLKYTDYNQLFTSKYDEWIDTASDIYREMNKKLGDQWDQFIVEHKQLRENVYCVTYEDGTRVFLNYGDQSTMAEGVPVEAIDYTVVDKEGRTK